MARRRLSTATLFLAVTGLHVFLTITLLFYVFGSGMARFDSGAPAGPTESVARWSLAAIQFPLLPLLERMPVAWFPGWWGYLPFLGNSSCWGLAAVVVRAWRRGRRAPHRGALRSPEA